MDRVEDNKVLGLQAVRGARGCADPDSFKRSEMEVSAPLGVSRRMVLNLRKRLAERSRNG